METFQYAKKVVCFQKKNVYRKKMRFVKEKVVISKWGKKEQTTII